MNVKITLGLALCFVIGIDIIIGFENATTEGTPQVEEIRRAEFIENETQDYEQVVGELYYHGPPMYQIQINLYGSTQNHTPPDYHQDKYYRVFVRGNPLMIGLQVNGGIERSKHHTHHHNRDQGKRNHRHAHKHRNRDQGIRNHRHKHQRKMQQKYAGSDPHRQLARGYENE